MWSCSILRATSRLICPAGGSKGTFITNRQFLVIAKNRAGFAARYGLSAFVAGEFSGELQNNGETLTLIKSAATSNEVELIVDKVRYESTAPWPTNANGTGSSLQLIDPDQENARVANWFSSYTPAVYCCGISTPATTNDGWRFVSATGTTPGGSITNLARLLVYIGEAGSALIDDVSLVPGTNAAVGTNFVTNGNFEAPLTNGTYAFTNGTIVPTGWTFGTNYSNTVIVADLVHTGAGAMKIVGSSPGAVIQPLFARSINQVLAPAPLTNVIHTLSFWFWATNSATNLFARVLNSGGLSAGPANGPTNINISFTPANNVPPTLVSAATNSLSPGFANQNVTNLPAFPSLWINEVQAENVTGIADNHGEREPWVEIYNTSTNTVSLHGLFLAPTYTNLIQWAFPPGSSIGPTQFLVVFCDGQELQTSNTEYHTSFRLPAASGSIALSRLYTNAPQVLDYVNYAGLHSNRSFGSYPDGQPFDRQEFFHVTPGGTNDGRAAPLVVFINEWMASNVSTETDPADGDFDDWFELYNPGTNAVELAGYFLTDTLTNKFKYQITTNGPHTIAPLGFLLVWADNEPGQNLSDGVPRADLHVNFQLARSGESIGLFAADGTQIDAVTFTNALDDASSGRFPDGSASVYAVSGPTPRFPNVLGVNSNTPPVLDAIVPKAIYLTQTLTFTATAHDNDLPAQVLTFSLDAGAPIGASIESGSGVFSWMPEAAGSFPVTVRVTDNGVPPLSASEAIVIEVLNMPRFTSSRFNGENFELIWSTRAGRKYAVDYKADLNVPQWTVLGTNMASGASLSFTNASMSATQRFFRVRVVE
jgi:hypothetical protein